MNQIAQNHRKGAQNSLTMATLSLRIRALQTTLGSLHQRHSKAQLIKSLYAQVRARSAGIIMAQNNSMGSEIRKGSSARKLLMDSKK